MSLYSTKSKNNYENVFWSLNLQNNSRFLRHKAISASSFQTTVTSLRKFPIPVQLLCASLLHNFIFPENIVTNNISSQWTMLVYIVLSDGRGCICAFLIPIYFLKILLAVFFLLIFVRYLSPLMSRSRYCSKIYLLSSRI